jgi:hypothetical protein
VTADELDAEVRRDLRGLQKDTAETVARHLVAAGSLVDDDPDQALAHARYARYRASRIALVREAAGIAAYHAGEWAEALGELRAARRMGGGPGHLAVMADIERALGRPERALDLARGTEAGELVRSEAIELSIVTAGARRDLGELDAAVVGLQLPELDPVRRDPWSARLFYAYADNLAAVGRESEAVQWFMHAADADEVAETDAAARLAELTGEPSPDDDVTFDDEIPSDAAGAAVSVSSDVDAPGHDESVPVDEGPVEEGPVEEGPVEEGPVEEGPVDEGPVDEGPVDEGPADEGPADETSIGSSSSTAADPVVSDALVADAEVVDALDRETDSRADRS